MIDQAGGIPAQQTAADDEDPAAPLTAQERALDFGEAVALANGAAPDDDGPIDGFETLATCTIDLDWSRAAAFYAACIGADPRVAYGLGAKIPGDTARPGVDFRRVDCSGFVRAIIRRSSTPLYNFPDGSVVQHDWVKAHGFAPQARGDAAAVDGKVRIAFLSPTDSRQGIGHVVLLHNGHTLESHGGTGPDRRAWTGTGWQAKAKVYMIDPG